MNAPAPTIWKEYRLLLYSAVIGIVGGLGAQLFVWLLNSVQRFFLVGFAGYQPPESGTLNPEAVIGPWGLWLVSTMIAFIVERAVSAGFKYPRLYEAQVELRSDLPTHLESMLKATFAVLERGPLVDLRNVTFPHLASLLRHGTPIPIHGGQGSLVTANIADNSQIAGRTIAEVFERFPQLLAVAIIRDQRIELPRGSTALESGDQLLVVGSETKGIETFTRVATNSLYACG